uniref:Uncharacterized protein n=1 Tax=Dicentrarchus labrax TaxID=13489 RepID=A0A8P4GB36_DICLA
RTWEQSYQLNQVEWQPADHKSQENCQDTQEQAQPPRQQTGQFGILWPTHSVLGQRMHQCHKAIYANQNEEVYAAVDIHIYDHVDNFAQEQTKNPIETIQYVDSPEGQTGHQNKVSSSQVAQVDLSHGAGLLMKPENHEHKHVKHNPQRSDQQDEHRHRSFGPIVRV